MPILIVVSNPKKWPLEIPGVEVVSARSYLMKPSYSQLRGAKVFNLCKSYRYQTLGYYVSLLAEARGHKPLPSISTIQDMKYQSIIRGVSNELDQLIQNSLLHLHSKEFVLSIYFGRNLAKKYDRLSLHLFNLFPAPLLRAYFAYDNNNKWSLRNIEPIPASEIPSDHKIFVGNVATEHFSGRRLNLPKRSIPRYHMAILYTDDEKYRPSNEKAIQRLIKAASSMGISTEVIGKTDYGRLAEFDALFIRETTSVNHHTYRFARRATSEGLVVIDDPESILKCTNKVYLAELMERFKIPTPKTMIVHRDNKAHIIQNLGYPCILKQPDSYFSQGVIKVEDEESLNEGIVRMLENSDLFIAQEFIPTPFDWRIGILDQQPLFACKYFMVEKHWQIIKWENANDKSEGKFETLPIEFAPQQVVRLALKVSNLIGNGFYGVDIKQIDRKCFVMEVNDNPNLDAGIEDAVLKDELYSRIMGVFLRRIERQKERKYY